MRPNRSLAAATALALTLALAACGGGADDLARSTPSPAPANPAPAPAAPAYTLAVDAQPLTARTTVDTARAASGLVTPDGATLVATGADGTTYRLSIPNDALLEPVTITMTPLATIAGLPFGEAMRGVRLEPDGLQFQAPVRLDVVARAGQAWPIAQQVAIGLQGAAQNVTLAPVDHEAETPGLILMHFSSYAVVLSQRGLDASLSGLRQRLGGDAEQRMQSAAGEELQRERQISLQGRPETPIFADVVQLLHRYHIEVLAPRLAAAPTSCVASGLALQTLFALQRQRLLLGLPQDDPTLPTPDIAQLMLGRTGSCMKEEFEICRDAHTVARIVPAAARMLRSLALAGLETTERVDEVSAWVDKCLRFDLRLVSTLDAADLGAGDRPRRGSERVESTLPLRMQGLFGHTDSQAFMKAVAPVISRDYSVTLLDPCDTLLATERRGGQLTALLDWAPLGPGDFPPGHVPGAAELARVKDFSVSLIPDFSASGGGSNYRARVRSHEGSGCGDPAYDDQPVYGWGSLGAAALFMLQADPALGGDVTSQRLKGFSVANDGSARLASKDVDVSPPDLPGVRLRMSLVLMHTPAGQ